MKAKKPETNPFVPLLKGTKQAAIPLGFYLMRPMGENGQLDIYLSVKSQFHQTHYYGVGSYYKPIANIDF
ncbi:MAG: hypothetical protein AAF990_18080 [Bacteroidota bacterium]